jgi:hypothetical protein
MAAEAVMAAAHHKRPAMSFHAIPSERLPGALRSNGISE